MLLGLRTPILSTRNVWPDFLTSMCLNVVLRNSVKLCISRVYIMIWIGVFYIVRLVFSGPVVYIYVYCMCLQYPVTKTPYSILCIYDMLLLKLHTVCSWYAVTKTPYSILYVHDLLLLLQILVNTAQQRQALNEVEQRHREIIALEHDIQV